MDDHWLVFSCSFTPHQSNKVQEVSRVIGHTVVRPGQILDLSQLPAFLCLKQQESISHMLYWKTNRILPIKSNHMTLIHERAFTYSSVSGFLLPLCEWGSCLEPRMQSFPPQFDRKPRSHRIWHYLRDWASTDDISPVGTDQGLVTDSVEWLCGYCDWKNHFLLYFYRGEIFIT